MTVLDRILSFALPSGLGPRRVYRRSRGLVANMLAAAVALVAWTAPADHATAAQLSKKAPPPKLLARLPGAGGAGVTFTADGRRLITAGADGLRVWELNTFRPLTGWLRHGAGREVVLAAPSPNGAKVLSAAGDEVRLWDAETGQHLMSLAHGSQVWAAAFSPDGSMIATGQEGAACVWDAATGERVFRRNDLSAVRFVAFSPDGRSVLSIAAGRRGAACLWDPKTGRDLIPRWDVDGVRYDLMSLQAELDKQPGARRRAPTAVEVRKAWRQPAAFSPDARRVATIYKGGVLLRDIRTGEVALEVAVAHPYGSVGQLAFSPDGKMLVTTGGGPVMIDKVDLWDTATGKLVRTLEWTFHGRTPEFSPNGRRVLLGGYSWDGRLYMPPSYRDDGDGTGIWDVSTGKQIFGIRGDTNDRAGELPVVAFSPDGTRLAVGFSAIPNGEGQTDVWDVGPGQR